MKKKIIILLLIFLSFNMGTIFFYCKYNSNEELMLTKKEIFDIIDNIEDIVITSISTDGQNYLSEENKLDATILYILGNKSKYQEYISNDYSQDLSSEIISFGKIDYNVFSSITKELFETIDYPIYEYKYFDNDMIDLKIEPFNYTYFDKKNVLSQTKDDNSYSILIEYITVFDDMENSIYVKYKLNFDYKIQSVIILSSTEI